MTNTEKELLEEKFSKIEIMMESNNKLMDGKLDSLIKTTGDTHVQATKTNGRVTKLEKQTLVMRWLTEKPLRFPAAITLVIIIYHNVPEEFWKFIKFI